MKIQIENCNNIDYSEIVMEQGKLNIKFAPNGTGKTTIAKAVFFAATSDEKSLAALLPFKHRAVPDNKVRPSVSGLDDIKSVMCFNEEYINSFVFKQDELVENSYEILFKTDEYRQLEADIESVVSQIRKVFVANAEYEDLIRNLSILGGAFKETKTGLAKNSPGMKGLSAGNKIQHIPVGLENYRPYIQSSECVDWIDWQVGGQRFMALAEDCPFCASVIAEKRGAIGKVATEYDKNSIKNLLQIKSVVEGLGDYFADDTRGTFGEIVQMKDGLDQEHENYIKGVKNQIDDLKDKLEKMRSLSGFDFSEKDKVVEQLQKFKINMKYFSHMSSKKTEEAVGKINDSLDVISESAGELQGKINKLRQKTQRLVEEHKKSINDFLRSAGYRYEVDIVGEKDKSQLKLKHFEHAAPLSGGKQYLSFGERNAFAIVLFMYECLAKNVDLVILDDPISSFDKNKKYAIMEMLFRKDSGACFKNKTVLLLTHDMEAIIDTVKVFHGIFYNQTCASFLKFFKNRVNDLPITKADIATFAEICSKIVDSAANILIKLIYLRRYFEIADAKGDAYQVLSSVLHGRKYPTDTRKGDTANKDMDPNDFSQGISEIQARIPSFDYESCFKLVNDKVELVKMYDAASSNYEKLQIFRIFLALVGDERQDPVVKKFINETYHVENEYICQLDPSKFDTIPEYIVDICSASLEPHRA